MENKITLTNGYYVCDIFVCRRNGGYIAVVHPAGKETHFCDGDFHYHFTSFEECINFLCETYVKPVDYEV